MDETPTQVLGEDARKNTTKSYMWVAKGGAEGQVKKQNLLPDEILALREEKVRPLLDKIADILKKSKGNVLPKSLLGQAITYGLNQWSRVEAYLKNPYLTPDNNVAENAIRPSPSVAKTGCSQVHPEEQNPVRQYTA